jgi:hypothetical protein
MRILTTCLLLIVVAASTLSADESDVVLRARADATEDARDYPAYWWGIGGAAITAAPVVLAAFFMEALPVEGRRAVALLAPVPAGASLALIGYCTGKAELSEARMAELQAEYGESGLASSYRAEYEKTLTKIRRRKQGTWAVMGSGVTVGVMGLGFLLVYLSK